MPIKPENKSRYPKNWKEIRASILQRANNKCEFCGIENYSVRENGSKVVLTIAHLDHTPENCNPENLRALCQKCHNTYDAEHRKETRLRTKNKEAREGAPRHKQTQGSRPFHELVFHKDTNKVINIKAMKIKFKKLNDKAVMPKKAHETDSGFDLVATSRTYQGGCYVYGTGLAIEIPVNHVGLIFPRSSISNTGLALSNCVGVIDSGFRGEITFKFRPVNDHPMLYNVGDRIGQLIVLPYPEFKFIESDVLSSTDRGAGGYGSTGR